MLKRNLFWVLAFALVGPAFGLDLQSTIKSGRDVPSLTNGEIAINRADRTLFFKRVDGTIGRGALMDATAAGRRSVEQGEADDLTVGSAALPAVLGTKAPLTNPTFSGTVTADTLVGNASGANVKTSVAGGVVRSLADSIEVTSKMLGAAGNGTTDDTDALRRINAAMLAGYTVRMEPGRYRIADTVVFDAVRGNLEAQGAVIVPDAAVLVPIQLGSAGRILSSRITGLVVDRVNFDSTRETEGFRLVNVSGVSLVDLEARYAKYNFRLAPGDGQRVSYVTLINPKAIYGFRNFWANPVQAGSGFVTSVSVFGGRFAGTVGGGNPNSNTVENARLDYKAGAVDLIRFFGTEMEGNQPVGIYVDAPSNVLQGIRFEGTFSTAAIQFGPNAQYNVVIDGYATTTVVDGGSSNRVMLATQTRFPSFVGIGLNRAPNFPIEADRPINGLTRFMWLNSSLGAARRVDHGLCTGVIVGAECLFYGVDQGATGFKAYIDNRSGGPLAVLASGTATHTLGIDGSFRISGGFGAFNAPVVTTKPTLPSAATDAASAQALANAMRTVMINYGLAQ